MMRSLHLITFLLIVSATVFGQPHLALNEKGYFEMPGLNVTVFSDIYPEGHQTGVTIIQHGTRVMANGDVRLEISPGQWSPIPKGGSKTIDKTNNTVSQTLWYPDSTKNRKGFNPIEYPDLYLKYQVNVTAIENSSFKISVDLDKPLPKNWEGKVGFNIEIFPTHVFGKTFNMDGETGIFPVQPNGGLETDQNHFITKALAKGKQLTIVPENVLQRIQITTKGEIGLYDGRGKHNNSWFIVRENLKTNTTKNALEWTISPAVEKNWIYKPVIHVSQVGYHPNQPKTIVIETDTRTKTLADIELVKITPKGGQVVKNYTPELWGKFLRYNYFLIDFTEITDKGMYQVQCGNTASNPFKIDQAVYQNHVWQPIIDYFLPVQMCHMRVEENYRVWHDLCHIDDALMAPTNFNHFDGYKQGHSTHTHYKTNDQVPNLDQGGWHDAGDYDLRVESQIKTIELLALMLQEFDLDYDATTIDQDKKHVEIHQADGKNDIVQQIEHGLLSVLGGYRAMGKLYRGIICQTLDQYTILGDAASMTDNEKWDRSMPNEKCDDRWVFTEENPRRECMVGAGLATTSKALQIHNQTLANECLNVALELWHTSAPKADKTSKINFAAALLSATGNKEFAEIIYQSEQFIVNNFDKVGWRIAIAQPLLTNKKFNKAITNAVIKNENQTQEDVSKSPFGIPYKPHIWGHAWTVQSFAVKQYFINKSWPEIVSAKSFMNALNFNLGVHPGENTASYASGVGSNSVLTAYGVNRADWSFIPGGVVSGTNLVRPDLPELKEWPYFWQQTEYVMGGGSTNFMFLVLAVDHYLNTNHQAD